MEKQMSSSMTITEGHNKFCGPAVLSILTGKSTDDCALAISSITGEYQIKGVQLSHLLSAANKLGYGSRFVECSDISMYRAIIQIINEDGMYIVTLPKHFVCLEIKNRQAYFCDNHTKEAIPAGSSARLMQKVSSVHKIFERPKPKLLYDCIQVLRFKNEDNAIQIKINRAKTYDMIEANMKINLANFKLNSEEELESLITQISRGY